MNAPPTPPALPTPPSDQEKRSYLAAGQGRWIFLAATAALVGIGVSYAGFAAQRYWTLFFFGPLALLVLTQVVSLRTSTYPRRVTLPDHSFLVETWAPRSHPSVDVFLPTAGEDVTLLRNTYSYVRALEWPGRVTVHVLDDAGRDEVAVAAREHGFRYLARAGSAFKKAGNLNHAYERTGNDLIVILDADFVPRPDMLAELVPYFDEPSVGIVQSPQYFATDRSMGWLERTAGATQELFYRQIQPARDAVGAAICVGTSAVYRRAALDAIGGFPLIGHSEDVYTGIRMARAGYELQYVPTNVTRGLCPTDVGSFIGQQYRWCSGSMALMTEPEFHTDTTMTLQQRLCFWSGFLHYVSTALTALLAPLPMLIMVAFFPRQIHPANMLPLLGTLVLWLVLVPALSLCRWRLEVLRVQTVYGFAHLFSVLDALRGAADDWVATGAGASARVSTATRVRRFMTPYLLLTQAATAIFLAVDVARIGVADCWASALLFLVGAYVLVPAALLGGRRSAGEVREADVTPGASDVVDLTTVEQGLVTEEASA